MASLILFRHVLMKQWGFDMGFIRLIMLLFFVFCMPKKKSLIIFVHLYYICILIFCISISSLYIFILETWQFIKKNKPYYYYCLHQQEFFFFNMVMAKPDSFCSHCVNNKHGLFNLWKAMSLFKHLDFAWVYIKEILWPFYLNRLRITISVLLIQQVEYFSQISKRSQS